VNSETMLTPVGEHADEELEASFLRGARLSEVQPARMLLPPVDVPPLGTQGPDDAVERRTVRTTSRYCC
jgi:hypothetical protein